MLLVAVAVALEQLALVEPKPADGALPGNGRIVFVNNDRTAGNPEDDAEIYTMNPDGTDIRQITSNNADDLQPAWSPDGRKLVFVSYRDNYSKIYKMSADGNNVRDLTDDHPTAREDSPAWSPDGDQIAFTSPQLNGEDEIYHPTSRGSGREPRGLGGDAQSPSRLGVVL